MLKYILKRLALSVFILIGVSLIIYILIRCMPSSFIDNKIAAMNQGGATVPQETIDAMKALYGLEDDSFLGIIKGYLGWFKSMCRLDFGTSFKYGSPVTEVIKSHMGVSFAVALIATIFEFMIAIPLGITAATHQYSIRDYVVTVLVMIGISLPSFFLGQIAKYVFAMKLGWLPSGGFGTTSATFPDTFGGMIAETADKIPYLILPIAVVVILSIGSRMRMTRTNMLEVLNSDYIRTARAKGLKESKVIYKHAFRNTLIPIVTSLAGLLPSLFSGAIITEQIFDLPGIGNIALQAMMAADIPFIMGYNMFLALLSVIGVLLADLTYAIVDPRVKLA
ncbi:MAG: ABC transporter permease [Clostridia bacterium]|nr:ABC transporter permease [Clostridia bacterium]MBR2908329.1 ABC transporter permease [Clostridia bacterium]